MKITLTMTYTLLTSVDNKMPMLFSPVGVTKFLLLKNVVKLSQSVTEVIKNFSTLWKHLLFSHLIINRTRDNKKNKTDLFLLKKIQI